MNEFRRARRRKAIESIEVQDTMTEINVGRIGNISETGMLMTAFQPLCDDGLFQLRFTLDDGRGRKRAVEVGAHQLWLDTAQGPQKCWIGFRFIDIGPDDASFLKEWIEAPGGQYV